MRLLEEFWYGNIEPTECDTNSCKEYKEVLRLITRNEEKLQATKALSVNICSTRQIKSTLITGTTTTVTSRP